jgi:hypothetical protein
MPYPLAEILTLERTLCGLVNQAHGLTPAAAKPYRIQFEG